MDDRQKAEPDRSLDEHRRESVEFYLNITRDANASTSDRLKARQQADKLLGIDSGPPAPISETDRELNEAFSGFKDRLGAQLIDHLRRQED